MRKVCVVITARPSYSRIRSVLNAIKNHSKLQLQLVVAASALMDKYGQVVNNIISDGFHPNSKIHMVVEGGDLLSNAKSTGMGIMELSSVFDKLNPDAVISIADRFETMATAISAAYQNIPLIHIQGGEVTGSIDEKVRHSVTKLSDIHFVSNKNSALRVEKMGEDKNKIFVTGCPSIDIAKEVKSYRKKEIKDINANGVGTNINLDNPFLVVLQHPVTYEWNQAKMHINQTLNVIKNINIPTVWFWPNIDAGSDLVSRSIRNFREVNKDSSIKFIKNLTPENFLILLLRSQCLIGNSSVGIRECSYLGVPVVNIGTRQLGRERGNNVIDVNYDEKKIFEAIIKQINHGEYPSEDIYGNGAAGEKIAHLLSVIDLTSEKKITY